MAIFIHKLQPTWFLPWIMIIATTVGCFYPFTSPEKLDGAGAPGSEAYCCMFSLLPLACIKRDGYFDNPGILVVGIIWLLIHITVVTTVAKLNPKHHSCQLSSMANIGGPVPAPVR